MNDLELWQLMKSGQKDAFEKIYRREVPQLLKYGKKFSRDTTLVEDCIQDLFIELWKNRKSVGQTDSIIKYLLVSLRRKIIRELSKRNKISSSTQVSEDIFEVEMSVDNRIINDEISKENALRLKKVIDSLSSRQKEVIYLKYYAGLEYEAIAEIMEINYQSVRNLNFKALTMLRDRLSLSLLFIHPLFEHMIKF